VLAYMLLMRAQCRQVYGDGSVRVAHPGVEIGQGLSVKVLQTAAYALSQVRDSTFLTKCDPPASRSTTPFSCRKRVCCHDSLVSYRCAYYDTLPNSAGAVCFPCRHCPLSGTAACSPSTAFVPSAAG
jgi:hypothetical protein